GDELYREAMDFVLEEQLDEEDRESWGRIHPAMMGGEYLPKVEGDEVEIARIDLQSVTADALEVRARRHGGAIRYRVVDEDERTFEITPRESAMPLSFGELIELIDTAANGDFLGLTDTYRDYNLEGVDDPEELLTFVSVGSAFYPQLEAYYIDRTYAWVEETRRAWASDPPPARQPLRLATEEEHLAYMRQRLPQVEEQMRGRPYREQKHVFSDIDQRSKFLNSIGFYHESAVDSEESGLRKLPDGREVLVAYLTVLIYEPND